MLFLAQYQNDFIIITIFYLITYYFQIKMALQNDSLKRDLSLFAAITIVVGNMIGAGIFGLPAALAKVATPVVILLAWAVVAIGIIFIALSYGNLSRAIPKAGGPVVYSEAALGKFCGYMVSLFWWVGSSIGNAAIVDLIFTQIVQLVPTLDVPLYKLIVTLSIVWLFTYINICGVRFAGWISIITTILKTSVFVLVILLALSQLNLGVFTTPVSHDLVEGSNILTMFSATVALVFWAFTGFESSTMAGGEIKNPEKNIPRSIIWGLSAVGVIYILINASLLMLLPQEKLANSQSPFADAINIVTGTSAGGTIINVAILISVVGALSGWILASGRSIYAASKDKFFLASFAKIHPKYATPYVALIGSSIITSIFFFLNFYSDIAGNKESLSHFVNITTIASSLFLPTYLVTVVSEYVLIRKGKLSSSVSNYIRILFAAIFSILFIYFGIFCSIVPVIYWIVAITLLGIGLLCYPIFRRSLIK